MNETVAYQVLLEWTRNKREVGRLTVEELDGKKFIHLRIWYRDKSGTLRPSKPGLTIPLEQLAPIRTGLRKVEGGARQLQSDGGPTGQAEE